VIYNFPIGGVCLYLGDVAQVSNALNPAWKPKANLGGGDKADVGGVKALLEAQGWMVCDGRELGVSAFPRLYSVLGNLYGGDAEAGVFCLPDLRGVFVRGVDHGAGTDPDLDKRLRPDGKSDYDGVGSMQWDALQVHQHDYKEPTGTAVSDKGTPAYNVPPDPKPTTDPLPSARTSKNETRARNVAVYYIIRYA
jgi:microcystin-dependent protein